MSKTTTFLLALCTLFLCNACSWVDDDRSDCPTGCWLKLSYTYNMLNVDAVTTQVKDATLFIFDKDGTCIGKEEVDSLTLHRNECMIRIPSLPEGDYSLLVWAGLADSHYQYTPASLALVRNEAGEQSDRLSFLFHGRLDHVHISEEYRVLTLPLTKDTNLLSCLLQSQSATPLNAEEFRLELTAKNGNMDHQNTPTDSVPTCYLPFMQENANLEDIQVVHAGMNTLRLMENDETRLKLIYVPSGEAIFNIPLTEYLLLSRTVDANVWAPQEYLDREDRYNLIFFLTPNDNPNKPYICLQMKVNGWILRLNEAELEANKLKPRS